MERWGGGEFMGIGGREVRVAGTLKDLEVGIGGSSVEEGKVGVRGLRSLWWVGGLGGRWHPGGPPPSSVLQGRFGIAGSTLHHWWYESYAQSCRFGGGIGTRYLELDVVREEVREELSKSRPLSHWTLQMVQSNYVNTDEEVRGW
jgi:hypothetical protein